MEYSEKVFDHFTNPRNVGEIENPSGVGEVGNAKCGDIMKIYLKISDDGIIEDVKFKTFGCGADGLPPVKMHCSVLAEEALRSAIADYYRKQGKDPEAILGCSGDCAACHGHE